MTKTVKTDWSTFIRKPEVVDVSINSTALAEINRQASELLKATKEAYKVHVNDCNKEAISKDEKLIESIKEVKNDTIKQLDKTAEKACTVIPLELFEAFSQREVNHSGYEKALIQWTKENGVNLKDGGLKLLLSATGYTGANNSVKAYEKEYSKGLRTLSYRKYALIMVLNLANIAHLTASVERGIEKYNITNTYLKDRLTAHLIKKEKAEKELEQAEKLRLYKEAKKQESERKRTAEAKAEVKAKSKAIKDASAKAEKDANKAMEQAREFNKIAEKVTSAITDKAFSNMVLDVAKDASRDCIKAKEVAKKAKKEYEADKKAQKDNKIKFLESAD